MIAKGLISGLPPDTLHVVSDKVGVELDDAVRLAALGREHLHDVGVNLSACSAREVPLCPSARIGT